MQSQKSAFAEPLNKKASIKTNTNQFSIVGIGASAGGLEAL